MLEFQENMTFLPLQFSVQEKSAFIAAPEVVSEFSEAWCLSIVSQAGSISFDICLRKPSSRDDEKELKKANLHASNDIFVNFGGGNVLFKPLVMLWIIHY